MTISEDLHRKHRVADRILELVKDMSYEKQLELLRELEDKLMTQKRKNQRMSYPMDVKYMSRGKLYQDFIQDISPTGVFIQTHESFSMGQELLIAIPHSDHGRCVKVRGKVVRITPEGIGVEFTKKT